MSNFRWMVRAGALLAAGLMPGHAIHAADTFPTRPMRIIEPAAPGGATDIASRVMADPMGRDLGQTVVVDNKAGGSGIIPARYPSLARQLPAFKVDEMARPLARLIGPVSCMERLVCYLGGPIEHD